MVSEIQPGQTFSCHPPAHLDTMGENNTLTALKGCGGNKTGQPGRRFHHRVKVLTVGHTACNVKGPKVQLYKVLLLNEMHVFTNERGHNE